MSPFCQLLGCSLTRDGKHVLPMTVRIRILTTLALLCHLVLVPALLTSKLQAQEGESHAKPPSSPLPVIPQPTTANPGAPPPAAAKKIPKPRGSTGEPITVSADVQEKQGDVYHLRGNVEIDFRKDKLRADTIDYDDSTGVITATGHIVFDGAQHDEHVTATRATYNVDTETGRFWDAVGTTGARSHGKTVVLTTSNPFFFRGAVVDKAGPDKYVVHHGMVTSCKLPQPKWTFRASHVTVVPGDDAKIVNSTFWLWRLPVFYFPFFDHSVQRTGPKTGLLMPTVGLSSTKGTILSDGFFWAINRSMNATLGAEYYSQRGWAQRVDFRTWLDDRSYLLMRYYGVVDHGLTTPQVVIVNNVAVPLRESQGGQEVRLNGLSYLRPNVRAVADVDYLSSYLFRIAFGQSFAEPINSEVRSTGFVTDNWQGYSFNAMMSRYQNFHSTVPDDVTTINHAPSFEASTVDRQLGDSRVYWGLDSALEGLSRSEPGFATASLVGRMDVYPHLSAPLLWRGWTLRPDIAVRDTWYSDSFIPEGTFGQPAGPPINRYALEGQLEITPPTVERVFNNDRLARSFKHTLEPRIIYRKVGGVSDFQNILRFDVRDVLSNTNELEYGLIQRLYSKPVPRAACNVPSATASPSQLHDANKSRASLPAQKCVSGQSREVLSWEVAQKYFFDPFFGGALVPGRRNVFATTVDFTGIAFLTEPRHFSPVISRFRLRLGNLDAEWQADYDTKVGQFNSSLVGMNYRLPHNLSISGSHAFLTSPGDVVVKGSQAVPPSQFSQFNVGLNYGHPNRKGFAFTANAGYDAQQSFLQRTDAKATYNWDCCGITFEYGQLFSIGNVKIDHQFRFSFSLANVGTFGTLPRAGRVF
jgi:LPS-assembly protein